MTHSQTSWPSLVLSVLLASAILGALAWCGRPQPPKPVETTPTVVVVVQPTVFQFPSMTPTARVVPTSTPREAILLTPTRTPVPPTATPQPTDTPEPPTVTPVRTMRQKG